MCEIKDCSKCKHFIYCDFSKIETFTRNGLDCEDWEETEIPLDLSFTSDSNEEMLSRASKAHSDNQPIVDTVFDSINKIRENY